jgi:hypothetical protein
MPVIRLQEVKDPNQASVTNQGGMHINADANQWSTEQDGQSKMWNEFQSNVQSQMQTLRAESQVSLAKAQADQAAQLEEIKNMLFAMQGVRHAGSLSRERDPEPQTAGFETPVANQPPMQPPGRQFCFDAIQPLPQDADYRLFRLWKKQWINNARVNSLVSFPRDVQVYALATALGPHGAQIAETHNEINLKDTSTTVELILSSLEEYYRAQRNIVVD